MTVDPDGNAYVTDSFSPVIYKVDPQGEASIFLQNDAFASEQFGLNGIDYHPDGYLLVAKADEGALFKVPLDDPEAFSRVELDAPVSGADGIVLRPDGALAVVGQPQSVFLVRSEDGWQTASIVETASLEQPATTAAIREGEVYAIFAQLSAMGGDDPPDVFPIVRVPFEDSGAAASMDAGAADDAGQMPRQRPRKFRRYRLRATSSPIGRGGGLLAPVLCNLCPPHVGRRARTARRSPASAPMSGEVVRI